ncbi:MAG TPA: hypothetical protein EYH26_01050 [Pyrodictium sp.]|nr:hypothetical protein [Pyrodictium sp.]
MNGIIRSQTSRMIPLTAYTAYIEPTDDLSYDELSASQKKVVDVVNENIELYKRTGATLKHGVIVVGSWGAGKSQVLRTMRRMGLIAAILERGEIYRWVSKDVELKKEKTIEKILENIRWMAERAKWPFIALDNPDIPLGSNVTEEAAFRFTWRLLEEATFGKLPYLIVTLNEFTYKKFSDEKRVSMAKIAQHFDIVRLVWSPEDIEKAVKTRLLKKMNIGSKEKELLKEVAKVARTPRSAIILFAKGLAKKKSILELIVDDGLRNAFEEYIRLLSQSGYKLSKAKSKRWVEVWKNIINNKKYRNLVIGLIKREGVSTRELYKTLGEGGKYKVAHWPVTAATRYHIIEKFEPLLYRFTDEFLAAATEYAAGLVYTALEILRNMAELYGKIGR